MAENSGIEWTHHTFNPWIGCTKVSAACDHCYAEAWDARFGGERWGARADRKRTSKANWQNPLRWQRKAAESGRRYRVFCASLADVFDNHRSIRPEWRQDLMEIIRQTPNLDWLLLTKRPQNIEKLYGDSWPENVWLGTTVENQEELGRRGQHLVKQKASIRFLSMEPLLEFIDLSPIIKEIQWVIVGGESGAQYRQAKADWFRSVRDQCANAGVPFLFKQWSGKNQREIKAKGRALDGIIHDGYPS